jgi:hypothetical protein
LTRKIDRPAAEGLNGISCGYGNREDFDQYDSARKDLGQRASGVFATRQPASRAVIKRKPREAYLGLWLLNH